MDPDSSLDGFFQRIKSELLEKRRRRIADLAKDLHLITPSQRESLGESASFSERTLIDRGWVTEAQLSDLRRQVDGESAPTPSSPLLARYELFEKLGEGSMSQVYRGMDRQLHRPVAVKILKENLLFQEAARRRFYREAQSLARMDHPNVVKVYDSGETGAQMYLVMEFVEGEALGSLLERKEKDRTGLLRLLEKAARGIHHAHQKGIIHRDVKPHNILVTRAGELKVADFGLAHLLDSEPGLTGTGTVLGTPLYMAPEQVAGGAEGITHRTDVYALGAILYEMVTGRLPHTGSSTSEVYGKILRENPVSPSLLAPGLPKDLEVIALKAIEKDPAHRYASAEEFAEDLRRYLAGEPILARPVSVVTRWTRWALQRQAVLWPVVGLASVLLVGASVWIGREQDRRRQQEQTLHRQGEATRFLESARPSLAKASQAQYRASLSILEFSRWVAEAEENIESALQQAPDLPLAHYLRGEVQILEGHYEEAERSWRKALELDPKFGSAHFRLGQVLLWQAYLENLDLWNDPKGLRREGSEKRAQEGARELTIAQAEGSGFDSELQREIAAAMLAFLKNQSDAVRQICGKGIERFGNREGAEEFHWLLGLLPGTQAEKLQAFDKAIEIKPMFPLALYGRAFACAESNTPEGKRKAVDNFNQAILFHPDFSEAYIYRGSILLQLKDIKGALADFDKGIATSRRTAASYNGRASVRLSALNDVQGAIADCDEAIRLQPDDYPLPYFNRAVANYRSLTFDAALRDAARAIEIGRVAGVNQIRQLRAKCYLALGDGPGAIAEMIQTVPPDTPRPEIDRRLGTLNRERLQDEQASVDQRQHRSQAKALLANGDTSGALAEIARLAPPQASPEILDWWLRELEKERIRDENKSR